MAHDRQTDQTRQAVPRLVALLFALAAVAGCSAIDVDLITAKRAPAIKFDVVSEGDKVRDDQGNHLTGLRLTFDLEFPDGADGDAARSVVQRSMEQSRDRLCSVSRTVQIGEPVEFRTAEQARTSE